MEELYTYCLPDKKKAKFMAFYMCAMAIPIAAFGFFGGALRSSSSSDRTLPIFFIMLCPITAWILYWKMYGSKKKDLEKCIKACGKKGLSEQAVLNDFRVSRPHFDGQLRVGQYLLFPKGKGYIFRYDEIESLGIKRINTNYTSGDSATNTYLEAKLRHEFYEICRIDNCTNQNVQVSQFANFISVKAPNIRLQQGERVFTKRVDDTSDDGDDGDTYYPDD